MTELPGNSYKAQQRAEIGKPAAPEAKPEPPQLEVIITGTVVDRKKPLGKRFAEVFFGGTAKDAANYAMFEVLIPALRDTILDALNGGLERLVKGGDSRRGVGRSVVGGAIRTYTNYNAMSKSVYRPDPREVSRGASGSDYTEVIFDRRSDADAVLERMFDLINEYGKVTVSQFKNLVGKNAQYTDRSWGWTDITKAKTIRDRDGAYYISLPDVEHLPSQ